MARVIVASLLAHVDAQVADMFAPLSPAEGEESVGLLERSPQLEHS